ncbi:MAG: hypothetical protein EOP84_34855, partial [Verrucomicrobiaceae bacterium]
MDNPGLPSGLWAILDGGLWHATSSDHLADIIQDGVIKVIAGRYENSFAKLHDAVSLFDFGPAARDGWGQFDNWSGWFGYKQDCRVAVWLQIDRDATASTVLDAGQSHHRWQDHRTRRFIPGVEALHVG